MAALSFRLAAVADAAEIAALVNTSYRGETSRQGWTTEADLLDGLRVNAGDVQRLIQPEQGAIASAILLCIIGGEIVATVCLEKIADAAHIGMFAVNPAMQGYGIGKQLLAYAESYARQHWAVNRFLMHVINVRHELIAFYERRGYRRTGVLEPFPVNPDMWQPKLAALQLETLEKNV